MNEASAFSEGANCLLRVMGEQFWVRVTEVGEEAIRVSFPGHDYPLADMPILLELHSEDGYRVFSTYLIGRGPTVEDGLILAPPQEEAQRFHRATMRIETDLAIKVKDQVSLKKHPGTLVNLSQGGALFITEGPFDFDSTLDITLELPGEPAHTLTSQVRHVDSARGARERNIGVRFISPDSEATAAIGRFITDQLRTLHSTR